MEQTSNHRDTEAQRTEKKGAFLCASVSLWLMQSIFSQLCQPWVCEPSFIPVPSPARAGEGCPALRDGVRAPSPRAGAPG